MLMLTAASGLEIALWDLAGRILELPNCNRLGGRFRDRVRFYRTTQAPANVEDMGAWRAHVQEAKAEKLGWTAFKFQGVGDRFDTGLYFQIYNAFEKKPTAADVSRMQLLRAPRR